MNDEPLFTITRADMFKGNQTLRIYSGLDKIEDQIYYTFKFADRQIVITQYNGEWIDLGGKDPKEANRLGMLLEKLDAVYKPKEDWKFLNPADYQQEPGNERQLLYDGTTGIYGVEKQILLPINGTLLSFDLQRIIVGENKVLERMPAIRLYEILINYNLEIEKPGTRVFVRSRNFASVSSCYFDYVTAQNREVYLVGITFGEFQPGRYLSQLIALVHIA